MLLVRVRAHRRRGSAAGVERVQPGVLLEVAVAYANGGKAAAVEVARGYL